MGGRMNTELMAAAVVMFAFVVLPLSALGGF